MTSPHPSPAKSLATRDANTSSPTENKDLQSYKGDLPEKDPGDKPKSMEYHRQILQSRLEEDNSKQKYISPSDTIMSPCTAKLSAYKNKQFTKGKPQSLFEKLEASKKATAVPELRTT